MALQGAFYGTTRNSRIVPKLSWSAVQSQEGNYSDITVTLSYSRTNTGYTTGGTWSGSITVGDQVFTGSGYIEVTYGSNTPALTVTARVFHDAYGALSVEIRGTGDIVNPADASLKDTAVSGVAVLDDIGLSSVATGADGQIGSRVTLVISRKNENYTHSLAYAFGGLSGYIDAAGDPVDTEQRFRGTVLNFLLPESFYGEIPDAATGLCTLTCCTYEGDTPVGSPRETQFRVTAPEHSCAPVLQPAIVGDEKSAVLTGSESRLIRFVTTAHCTAGAAAQKGASLQAVTVDGEQTEDGSLEIPGFSQNTVVFTATDSRGYTTRQALAAELIPYVQLSLHPEIRRTDPTSGNAVLTVRGSCWKGSFGAVENSLQLTVTTGAQRFTYDIPISDDHTYTAQLTLSGLDYTSAHWVTVTAADAAMETAQTVTVHRGLPVFDWGGEDFRFRVPVEVAALTVGGVPLRQYILDIQGESQ